MQSVNAKARRKIRARDRASVIWFGLGTLGMVGWSVAIPIVVGIAIGVWLDANTNTDFSWTLTLMITGVIVGSMTAWYWIQKEQRMIEREREDLNHE